MGVESSTEALRRLLDERGVPWKDYGYENHTWWGEWHAENRPSVNGLFLKVEGVVTPEQAIAATLGTGTCHVEQTGHVKVAGVDYYDDDYECSECGAEMFEGYNYCPNCGRRIEQ